MRPIETELQMTKFDLALNMVQTPKGLDGGFEFSLDLLDAATVASFADDFDTVLNQVTEDPDISLRALRQAVSRKRLTGRHSEREISFRQKLRTSRRQ
jgi:hypothetical protein